MPTSPCVYRTVTFAESHTVDTATLRRIRDWCLWEEGIVVFSKHSPPLRTVGGDELLYQRIVEADGAIVDEGPKEGYFRFIGETLMKSPVLSPDVREIVTEDSKTPNLFFTLFEDGEMLIYNESPNDVTWGFEFNEKHMRPAIPAYGMWSSKTAGGAGP
jgi:hypothetical protein